MNVMADSLAQRVLDAIGETERAATAMAGVYPEPWDIADRGWMARVVADAPSFHVIVQLDQHQAPDARWLGDVLQHVILNGPKAVLRRCAADREIIDQHPCDDDGFCGDGIGLVGCKWAWPCPTIRLLARGYGITEEDTQHG